MRKAAGNTDFATCTASGQACRDPPDGERLAPGRRQHRLAIVQPLQTRLSLPVFAVPSPCPGRMYDADGHLHLDLCSMNLSQHGFSLLCPQPARPGVSPEGRDGLSATAGGRIWPCYVPSPPSCQYQRFTPYATPIGEKVTSLRTSFLGGVWRTSRVDGWGTLEERRKPSP